jgi:hypothetical protein
MIKVLLAGKEIRKRDRDRYRFRLVVGAMQYHMDLNELRKLCFDCFKQLKNARKKGYIGRMAWNAFLCAMWPKGVR